MNKSTVHGPFRMFDSAGLRPNERSVRTRDTVLSPVTSQELVSYFNGRAKLDPGKVWDGVFKPVLEAMDEESREELLGEIENYSSGMESTMQADPAGSFASTGDRRGVTTKDFGRQTTPEAINEANKRFWDERTAPRRRRTVDARVPRRATPESINEANRNFWAARG
jgi:hypothetical protein